MSYNYAPPPPPPAQTVSSSYPHPPAQYAQHPTPRGGPAARSRGGRYQNGRPEYVASYEYAAQPYSPQTPLAYGSPHAPASGYPPQQWHEHPHAALPHAPAPISASNYHPNYVPQSAYPQPHYPQPAYAQPSQAPYAPAPYPNGPPPAPTPWHGQSSPQASYTGGRPRGGYQAERGGARGASMTAPVRMGFEGEPGQPQAPNGYVQSYQGRPPALYQSQQYYPQPPPPPGVSPRQDFYQSRGSRRGRGGTHRDSTRGRLPFHGVDKSRPQKKEANGPAAHPAPKTDAPGHGKKKKRKVNTLGLTPGEESASEDNDEEQEEEDDEERLLTKLIGVEAMQITDMDAYIAERKKRYPTKERVEAKRAAELAHKSSADQEAALLEKEADKLRRQLKKVESSIKRKREQQDEGDEMRDSSSEEEKSDDDEPEVMSSRPQNPSAPQPPAKKADVTKHCKYYSTGGSCGKKGKCRFVHDPAVREAALREKEENNGQMTIKQRLILNDKDQEDLTILESIQYLRDKGLMAKPPAGNETTSGDGPQPAMPKSPEAPSLPAPPPSLPRPPIKRESTLPAHKPPTSSHASSKKSGGTKRYLGWNLSGYGNSGVRSDDLP